MKNKELSLTDGVPLLKILIFCSPLFVVSLISLVQTPILQSFYSSSKMGTLAFSIPAMFVSFWQVFQAFVSGFNIYSGVKVASCRAAGDVVLEKKYFINSFFLTIFVKVVISAFALVFYKPIFKLLSIPTELYDIVFLYYVLHIVANILINLCSVIADMYYGLGSVKSIFILRTLSPILVIFTGVIFFKLFDLGIVGLTFLQVPASLFCITFYFIILFGKKNGSKYSIKDFKIDFSVMKDIAKGSFVYTLRQVLITICAFICQVKVNASLNDKELTAMGIGLPLGGIFVNFGSGFRLFATKNHTIKNFKFLKKGVNQTLILLTSIALVCMGVYWFLGESYMAGIGLVGEYKTTAVEYWRYFALFQFPALIILCSIRFMFEGAGFKNLAFMTGLAESFGYLLTAFIFIPCFGSVFAMNYSGVGYSISALFCLIFYFIKRKNIYGETFKKLT